MLFGERTGDVTAAPCETCRVRLTIVYYQPVYGQAGEAYSRTFASVD